MILKGVVIEDFVNYKVPSMFLIFPHCSMKCCWEAGENICQNSELAQAPERNYLISDIVRNYRFNDITKAVVFGGLEPFDSYEEMIDLIRHLREYTDDDIVIYTGYNEDEVDLTELETYPNIIIKFGRFIPNDEPRFDEVLGVELKSKNQYAKKIS